MSVWGWVQAIATGWFVLSILLAVAWALGGKRIFRAPPAPPAMDEPDDIAFTGVYELDLHQLAERRRRRGEQ